MPDVRSLPIVAVIAAGWLVVAGCSTSGTELEPPEGVPVDGTEVVDAAASIQPRVTGLDGFVVDPETFEPGAPIPDLHARDGDNAPPPLVWSDVPDAASELAIVVQDADADDFVHWIVAGIPPDAAGLIGGRVPEGAEVLANDFGAARYDGPAPPPGETHTYVFTVYALDADPGLAETMTPTAAATAINQVAMDAASVSGTYTG